MANFKGRGGLGKGLSALIPQETDNEHDINQAREIPIAQICVNPFQPRREFNEEKLAELTESIKRHGVVQPILLRQVGDNQYQLVAGERRFRAALKAGLKDIPAVVKQLNDGEMMEIALIENIQREDLNPVEEARAYKRLAEEFSLTQEQIAQRVSKSRSFIANSVRLLNLPEEVLEYLSNGQLTTGHVRPLLTLDNNEAHKLAQAFVAQKATVREAEAWARNEMAPKQIESKTKTNDKKGVLNKNNNELPIELKEIQRVIREKVETKVEVSQNAKGGKIVIEYYNHDDLDRILALITGNQQID